ncbi:MAG TPA: phasin family protein [Rubricoccaceae bacterium]|nr:phasin family protein [Rubricoccaceae bacterium]
MSTTTMQRELKKTTDDAVQLARTTADSVQKSVTEAAGGLKETTERIFLAGLGAFALAEEEGSKLFDKLVKKGRKVELPELGGAPLKHLRRRLDEGAEAVTSRAKDARYVAGEAAEKAEDRLQEAVAAVMKRLGVPTQAEVAALTASVERLNKRLDALKKERAKQPEPEVSFTMESVGGGWYELAVNGVVVEKVQGKEEAEAALARLAEQKA